MDDGSARLVGFTTSRSAFSLRVTRTEPHARQPVRRPVLPDGHLQDLILPAYAEDPRRADERGIPVVAALLIRGGTAARPSLACDLHGSRRAAEADVRTAELLGDDPVRRTAEAQLADEGALLLRGTAFGAADACVRAAGSLNAGLLRGAALGSALLTRAFTVVLRTVVRARLARLAAGHGAAPFAARRAGDLVAFGPVREADALLARSTAAL